MGVSFSYASKNMAYHKQCVCGVGASIFKILCIMGFFAQNKKARVARNISNFSMTF